VADLPLGCDGSPEGVGSGIDIGDGVAGIGSTGVADVASGVIGDIGVIGAVGGASKD
jgi:hypothetical protein